MLQVSAIGHIGGDAELKASNGKEFITFRIAHTDRWTDEANQVHESTTWIDCIMSGKPAVFEYLKKGQMVFVNGSCTLRIYSSAKERCMKPGLTINVRQIELLGGKTDEIPSVLFDATNGAQIEVKKYFNAPTLVRDEKAPEWLPLVSRSQAQFVADRNGWIQPYVEEPANG